MKDVMALCWAASQGDLNEIKRMVANGVNLEDADYDGRTCIHLAASEGKIDILIGTHAILNKRVVFKDLGLLIIDEEQKFGVSSKEKLRNMKVNVDTLTLTATPIPRTLQFSLLAARDLSVINTPPPNRQPIETEL